MILTQAQQSNLNGRDSARMAGSSVLHRRADAWAILDNGKVTDTPDPPNLLHDVLEFGAQSYVE